MQSSQPAAGAAAGAGVGAEAAGAGLSAEGPEVLPVPLWQAGSGAGGMQGMVGSAGAALGCTAAAAAAPGSRHCCCPGRCHTSDPRTDPGSPLPGY